jgi:hypothetical protein
MCTAWVANFQTFWIMVDYGAPRTPWRGAPHGVRSENRRGWRTPRVIAHVPALQVTRGSERHSLEREPDGIDGVDHAAARGFDDGADVGMEGGAPFAAEAVGDLAIDGAWPQRPLGAVVGRRDIAVGDEHE